MVAATHEHFAFEDLCPFTLLPFLFLVPVHREFTFPPHVCALYVVAWSIA